MNASVVRELNVKIIYFNPNEHFNYDKATHILNVRVLWCRVDVEDYLRSRWGPLEVSSQSSLKKQISIR